MFRFKARIARKASASVLTLLTCVHAGNSGLLLRTTARTQEVEQRMDNPMDGVGRVESGTETERLPNRDRAATEEQRPRPLFLFFVTLFIRGLVAK